MALPKRTMGTLLCCGALAACGGSSNPNVSGGGFVGYCQKQTTNVPAGVDKAALCRCIQQKLVAAGYGNRRLGDPAVKEAPESLIEPCFSGGAAGSLTPNTTTT
jgi:hypothetical protein